MRPQARIVNLETSITTSDEWCREKEIHYRMHPANVGCLAAAGIDVAVLANNHVMDFGRAGLLFTSDTGQHNKDFFYEKTFFIYLFRKRRKTISIFVAGPSNEPAPAPSIPFGAAADMNSFASLQANLLSPITLAFALGLVAKVAKSEISLPKDLHTSLSIYLLFALGLKGGVELTHASAGEIIWPACATLLLGVVTPITTYLGMRRVGGFSVADSAGVAAHYGSVSAVTFIAAQHFCVQSNLPLEGYLPTLLTLMESPGIHMALAIGAIGTLQAPASALVSVGAGAAVVCGGDVANKRHALPPEAIRQFRGVLHEVITGRTMVLLVGGLIVGYLMGDAGYRQVQPFFESGFKGALTLFILEMGLTAGGRLGDLRKVGPFLVVFGVALPVLHGFLGAMLGHWAGLSVGGCTVLAAMAASASYIAAPPAVRMTLPEANPTYSLTLALAITFPFNLVLGIPLYERFARFAAGL